VKTPDLTLAQVIVVVKNVVAVAVAFGLPLSSSERISILALAGSLGIALIAADAMIRRARAQHLAGPVADADAAHALAAAAAARKATAEDHRNRFVASLETEAASEAEARAANDAAPLSPADNTPSGVDPAAPTG
jgi:hypothetical protein